MKGLGRLTLTCAIFCLFPLTLHAQNKPSEQKTGSVLVFPYYTSNDFATADTFMSISNAGTTSVSVHLFFMEGRTCQQADVAVYLTPNATITLRASVEVPMETGYLIAVGLDQSGNLITNGGLTGSAFVKAPAGVLNPAAGEVVGNYGATAFNAYSSVAPAFGAMELNFDGVVLDAMPTGFVVPVQSPNVAPGQTIVMAGMNGNLIDSSLTGANQIGSGQAFSENEVFRSFSALIRGGCQSITLLTNTSPRIVFVNGQGLSGLIAPGAVGLLKFTTEGGAGVLITPKNNTGWAGIRNLAWTRTSSVKLTIPSY